MTAAELTRAGAVARQAAPATSRSAPVTSRQPSGRRPARRHHMRRSWHAHLAAYFHAAIRASSPYGAELVASRVPICEFRRFTEAPCGHRAVLRPVHALMPEEPGSDGAGDLPGGCSPPRMGPAVLARTRRLAIAADANGELTATACGPSRRSKGSGTRNRARATPAAERPRAPPSRARRRTARSRAGSAGSAASGPSAG